MSLFVDFSRSEDFLANHLKKLDLRHADQRERDFQRRLNSQCDYMGWYTAEDDDKEQTPHLVTPHGRIFRRCRDNATREHYPRCATHAGKTDGDPNDPHEWRPKKGNGSKKGGSLSDVIAKNKR